MIDHSFCLVLLNEYSWILSNLSNCYDVYMVAIYFSKIVMIKNSSTNLCSFVPRLFDYHPLAIPAPYNHSNIDSDEVLYYAEGNFMSRKGIGRGSFTLHPGGLPHGPHPGTVEKSIGAKETHELAVMIDTFRPLHLTQEAAGYVDKKYPMSWTENSEPFNEVNAP